MTDIVTNTTTNEKATIMNNTMAKTDNDNVATDTASPSSACIEKSMMVTTRTSSRTTTTTPSTMSTSTSTTQIHTAKDVAISNLRAMKQQEEESYKICYDKKIAIDVQSQQHPIITSPTLEEKGAAEGEKEEGEEDMQEKDNDTSSEEKKEQIDDDKDDDDDEEKFVECQRNMILWCYRLANVCGMQKETVEIAMSMTDRYIMNARGEEEEVKSATNATKAKPSSSSIKKDLEKVRLVFMTSFYVASKVHEQKCLTPPIIEDLTDGLYTQSMIEQMEIDILFKIQWKINPPTCTSFARNFIQTIPKHLIPDVVQNDNDEDNNDNDDNKGRMVWEILEAQIEQAIVHGLNKTNKVSTIAAAALLNALEIVTARHNCMTYFRYTFARSIGTDVSVFENGLTDLQRQLRHLVVGDDKGNNSTNNNNNNENNNEKEGTAGVAVEEEEDQRSVVSSSASTVATGYSSTRAITNGSPKAKHPKSSSSSVTSSTSTLVRSSHSVTGGTATNTSVSTSSSPASVAMTL